jgi:hypothetical protein
MADDAFSLDDDERVDSLDTNKAASSGPCLKLLGSDGKHVAIDTREQLGWITSLCGLIRTSLEGDDKCRDLPIPSIESTAIEDVVTFCYMRRGEVLEPLPSINSSDIHAECLDLASAAYISQVGTPAKRLHALINTANHLDCSSLVDLAVTQQACILSGLGSIEAIRNSLHKGAKR